VLLCVFFSLFSHPPRRYPPAAFFLFPPPRLAPPCSAQIFPATSNRPWLSRVIACGIDPCAQSNSRSAPFSVICAWICCPPHTPVGTLLFAAIVLVSELATELLLLAPHEPPWAMTIPIKPIIASTISLLIKNIVSPIFQKRLYSPAFLPSPAGRRVGDEGLRRGGHVYFQAYS